MGEHPNVTIAAIRGGDPWRLSRNPYACSLYLDIRTVIVSCGTCLDQLEQYEFGRIFPGSRLLDIHEYLLEKGVKTQGGIMDQVWGR